MRKHLILYLAILSILGCGKTAVNVNSRGVGTEPSITPAANQDPVASNDVAWVDENGALFSISVLSNDTDADGDSLSLAAVSDPPMGTAAINGSQIDYTPDAATHGTDTFTYTLQDSEGNTSLGTVTVHIMTGMTWWGGGGDQNWDTPANWCKSVNVGHTGCTGGLIATDVPDNGDTAVFNGGCTQCDADINLNLTIDKLEMLTGYTGTLTQQNGFTFTVDSNPAWLQEAGHFVGGDQDISVGPNMTISGGTFNNTSAMMTVDPRGAFNATGGTLDMSNSTFKFGRTGLGAGGSITTGGATFNNVIISFSSGASNTSISLVDDMDVNGNLTLEDPNNGATKYEGIGGGKSFYVSGDVTIDDALNYSSGGYLILDGTGVTQNVTSLNTGGVLPRLTINAPGSTINFSGNVQVAGNFTHTASGSVNFAGSTLILGYISLASRTITSNGLIYGNVTLAHGSGASSSSITFADDMNIDGNLLLDDYSNGAAYDSLGGTSAKIYLSGDLTIDDTKALTYDTSTATTIVLDGSGITQNVTSLNNGGYITNMQINAPGSTINFTGNVQIGGDFTYTTAGSVNFAGSELILGVTSPSSRTITSNGLVYGNLTLAHGSAASSSSITLADNMDVGGNLTIDDYSDGTGADTINGGTTIYVAGDLSVVDSKGYYGNVAIVLDGSSLQTITQGTGAFPEGGFTFNNAAGFQLASSVDLGVLGVQSIDVVNGDIDMNGFNFIGIDDISTYTGTITKNGGQLDYVTCSAGGCPADDI